MNLDTTTSPTTTTTPQAYLNCRFSVDCAKQPYCQSPDEVRTSGNLRKMEVGLCNINLEAQKRKFNIVRNKTMRNEVGHECKTTTR